MSNKPRITGSVTKILYAFLISPLGSSMTYTVVIK